MMRTTLLASAALLFAGSAAFADTDAVTSADRLLTVVQPRESTESQPVQLGGDTLYNNIATKYAKGLYFCCSGGTLSGPSSRVGESIVQAIGFTPKESGNATTITAGVGFVTGTNSVTLALYSDNNGTPGTQLASGTATSLPTFGVCCTVVSATISSTALTAGTQYWVVATTPGDTWDAWNDSTTDQVDKHLVAQNVKNTGWTVFSTPVTYAVSVK